MRWSQGTSRCGSRTVQMMWMGVQEWVWIVVRLERCCTCWCIRRWRWFTIWVTAVGVVVIIIVATIRWLVSCTRRWTSCCRCWSTITTIIWTIVWCVTVCWWAGRPFTLYTQVVWLLLLLLLLATLCPTVFKPNLWKSKERENEYTVKSQSTPKKRSNDNTRLARLMPPQSVFAFLE